MNKHDIIKILESEYKRHSQEIENCKRLLENKESTKQKNELVKHYNKRNQTKKIVELLGWKVCEECGGVNDIKN